MQLINTDGMAFFGPGSEWFWSMLHLVAIVITLVGLYLQVRLQTSSAAAERMTAFEEALRSERITRHKLEVLVALRAGVDPADLPRAAVEAIVLMFFKPATLLRRRQVDRKLVWSTLGPACSFWWGMLEPSIRALRAEPGNAPAGEWFEWLALELAEMDRKVGREPSFVEEANASGLDSSIRTFEDQLRVEQALRSVTLVSPDALIPVRPVATVVAEA